MPLFLHYGLKTVLCAIPHGARSSAACWEHISSWRSLMQHNFRVRSRYANHKI